MAVRKQGIFTSNTRLLRWWVKFLSLNPFLSSNETESMAIFEVGNTVIPPVKFIKNIDFGWGRLPHQESIVLHIFEWRENSVTNYQWTELGKMTLTMA